MIVGDASDRWIKEFVENVLIGNAHVEIFSITNSKFKDWYQENKIIVHELRDSKIFSSKIPGVRTALYLLKLRKFIKIIEADFVLCIYSNWMVQLAFTNIRKHNIVYWYMGSDLLRTPKLFMRIVRNPVNLAKQVIVISKEMKTIFEEQYPDYKGKVSVVDFGCSNLDYVDSNNDSIENCRRKILGEGVEKKTVVALGYNGSSAQQVDCILHSLRKMDSNIKEMMLLVIPMQYGRTDKKYIARVSNEAKKLGIDYAIITDYYDAEKMSQFVKATDVFVNAQKTDAMSAALVEHLYGGTVVLNASWLHYSKLEDMGVYSLTFDSFEALGELLHYVLNNISECRMLAANNHEKMKKSFGWDRCKYDFYDAL